MVSKPRRTNQDDEQAHVYGTGTHMLITPEQDNNLSYFFIYNKIKKMGLDYVPSTFNNSIAAGITNPKNVNTAIVMAICINPLP